MRRRGRATAAATGIDQDWSARDARCGPGGAEVASGPAPGLSTCLCIAVQSGSGSGGRSGATVESAVEPAGRRACGNQMGGLVPSMWPMESLRDRAKLAESRLRAAMKFAQARLHSQAARCPSSDDRRNRPEEKREVAGSVVEFRARWSGGASGAGAGGAAAVELGAARARPMRRASATWESTAAWPSSSQWRTRPGARPPRPSSTSNGWASSP